jgi:hypothetical protein
MVGRRPDEHGNFVIHVYVMSADGSDVRRVSESGTPFQVFGGVVGRSAGSPVWLPDGSGLYYHTLGGDGREIRRFALDGFGETRVVADGLSPAVAKDGRIAFVRPQPREGMDDFDVLTRTGRIFSVTADGADLRAESDVERSCFAPDIDRRSGRMVCHGPSPVEGLVTVDIPGGGWAFAPPGALRAVELPDRVVGVTGIRGYFPGLTASGEVVSSLFSQGVPGPLVVTSIDGTNSRTVSHAKEKSYGGPP